MRSGSLLSDQRSLTHTPNHSLPRTHRARITRFVWRSGAAALSPRTAVPSGFASRLHLAERLKTVIRSLLTG